MGTCQRQSRLHPGGSDSLSPPVSSSMEEVGTIFGNATTQIINIIKPPELPLGSRHLPRQAQQRRLRRSAHLSLESQSLLLECPSEAGSKVAATPEELRSHRLPHGNTGGEEAGRGPTGASGPQAPPLQNGDYVFLSGSKNDRGSLS